MATNFADALREGTQAAARLQQKFDLRTETEAHGGSIDVFGTIHRADVPLLIRPLQGLLGAYLTFPAPGILVTTQRPMSVQRFTAAHEFGHFALRHQPSFDDPSMLLRMPIPQHGEYQEIEATAFAVEFMMPRWLIAWHAARQGWTAEDFRQPNVVYQLSLRLGASYEAMCWTLVHHNVVQERLAKELLETAPRTIKSALLEAYKPPNYRGDVWLLTERDAGTRIDGSRNDLFVLKLTEHCGGGYLWDIDQLRESGFGIARDDLEAIDGEGVGGPAIRRVTASPPESQHGSLSLDERRPWEPGRPLSSLIVEFDLTGPESEGLSRAERRRVLEAA